MRNACGLVVVLGCLGWFACEVEVPAAVLSNSQPTWRRTVDGWEPQSAWARDPVRHPAALHPATLATAELLFSLLALSAIPASAAVRRQSAASLTAKKSAPLFFLSKH